jgi:hypothetical protein
MSYPGPWITSSGTYSGSLPKAKRVVSGLIKQLAGGATVTTSLAGATTTYQALSTLTTNHESRTETTTSYYGPNFFPVGNPNHGIDRSWSGGPACADPFFDGLLPWEPVDLLGTPADPPGAVGWELQDPNTGTIVQFLIGPRCTAAGLTAEYNAWLGGGAPGSGSDNYDKFLVLNAIGPIIDGTGTLNGTYKFLSRTASSPPPPFSATTQIGSPTAWVVQPQTNTAVPNRPYADIVYSSLVNTAFANTFTVTPTEPLTTPQTGFTGPLPARALVTPYGWCRVPAFRFTEFPSSQYPDVLGPLSDWRLSGALTFTATGTANIEPWRWLFATPQIVTLSGVRQRQRGDGLALSMYRWRGHSSVQKSNRLLGHR